MKIGFYNNKGGVAKTTSVINVAYALSRRGKKVLVVDCDTQENCFGFFFSEKSSSRALSTDYDNIDHTTWALYQEEFLDHEPEYDYVLFDLPPAMSDEVREILRYCGNVYVPTLLGEFEIAGLRKVTEEILRQHAKLGGVFVTMYNKDNDSEIIEDFKRVMQGRTLKTIIPFSKTVRESQKAGLPVEAYFEERKVPRSQNSWKIVDAYNALTDEIMERGVV